MLKNYNNETKLNEYIDYLKDKGKIIKIKDTKKNINVKLSSGILFYFLIIVSVLLIILTIYLIGNTIINPNTEEEGNAIIIVGTALLALIILGVALNEKKNLKFNVTYPSENQIKVNNKLLDIKKEDCYIDIIKKYEYNPRFENNSGGTITPRSHTVKYFLSVKGNRILKLIEIKNGMEEQLKHFIYNFEFEISDFKKEKNEILQNMQEQVEKIYKNENR